MAFLPLTLSFFLSFIESQKWCTVSLIPALEAVALPPRSQGWKRWQSLKLGAYSAPKSWFRSPLPSFHSPFFLGLIIVGLPPFLLFSLQVLPNYVINLCTILFLFEISGNQSLYHITSIWDVQFPFVLTGPWLLQGEDMGERKMWDFLVDWCMGMTYKIEMYGGNVYKIENFP